MSSTSTHSHPNADDVDSLADAAAETLDEATEKASGFAQAASEKLGDALGFVRKVDAKALLGDAAALIRNNPVPALIGAVAIGFLLAKTLSRKE
jgi:ElaB/YqjD/DUF883 family membrane-anchored ribosome-binding protein